jgi:hypothetical protein
MVTPLTQNIVKAYCLGFMFGLGVKARQTMLTKDENIPDKDLIFRTAKNGKKIAINTKTKEVSGLGNEAGYSSTTIKELYGNEITGKNLRNEKAVSVLLSMKHVHIKDAFHRDGIGDIDLVWGNDNAGLQHIIKRRRECGQDPEKAVKYLPEIINKGSIINRFKVNDTQKFFIEHSIGNTRYRLVIKKGFTDKNGIHNNRFVLTNMEIYPDRLKIKKQRMLVK